MPSSTRMPPRTLPCRCRVRDDLFSRGLQHPGQRSLVLCQDVPHPPRRAHVLKTRISQRDRSTTMIKDILVVLTVTSAIVVIGLALFNQPARSAEWAVLPPIEYEKPYANISIWEARDVYQVQEWCNLQRTFYYVACARRLYTGLCVIIKLSDEDLIRFRHPPEYVMRHEHGHCNGWHSHEGARVPTPTDNARWRSLYEVSDLYKGAFLKGAQVP